MGRKFLLINITITTIFCMDILENYDNRFEARYNSLNNNEEVENVYPARALVRSLIVPGWGQIYNKSSWWKSALFMGVEIAALSSWLSWNQKAEDLRVKYELYADSNWSLDNWIVNTTNLQNVLYDSLTSLGYDWDPDVHIIGTHGLDILYNDKIYSSDCLYYQDWFESDGSEQCLLPGTPEDLPESLYNEVYIPDLIADSSIIVIKDRDYYENIGKYDQFVGGWEGILNDYIIQYKDVGDTTEIIISSPLKDNYLSQREKSNEYLNLATYAVSAVMFNHVISAFEAVWTSTRNPKIQSFDTSTRLLYNKNSKYGIGGISFSIAL